ncbi:hypothetical protein J5N97_018113 [Dioscorea zingiberensis]|uniref:Dirigent protein n=1 Tax=Dioscorea zingiberensis TaxID=325984 RepID=A0A9D5CPG4_9LILI|nr:hypothetical protein J5N97_018113 [Dioscorea zingiberensis]
MATTTTTTLLLLLLSSGVISGELTDIKRTHIRFFFHNSIHRLVTTPANPILQPVPMQTNSKLFGSIAVLDDPLTEGPDRTSKLVGRAQGVSVFSSRSAAEPATLMNVNLIFTGGKHNGSTLVVLGRNAIHSEIRELPVIAGTGKFRLARGYAKVTTHSHNLTAGRAVVEYNVHVFHH